MKVLLLVAALSALLVTCAAECDGSIDCNSTYIIVVPKKLRAGRSYDVSVQILQADEPVMVTAKLQSGEANFEDSDDFAMGENGLIQLPIPSNEQMSSYTLVLMGSGGLRFNHEQTITRDTHSMSILVQTDKAQYKPGDLVRFRVVGVYQDLKPYMGAMTIEIMDSKSNKVKQWRESDLVMDHGFVTLEFQLTEQTNLGQWKIHVETEFSSMDKVITVAEYVLPKFEVSIATSSSFLHMESTELRFTVNAKYTYGENVKGTVAVNLRRKYCSYYQSSNCGEHTISGELVNGKFEVVMSRAELAMLAVNGQPREGEMSDDQIDNNMRSFSYNNIIINATVVETLTGIELGSEKPVQFYEYKHTIEWLESTPTAFKPGLTWVGHVRVTQSDGSLPDTSDLVYPNDMVRTRFAFESALVGKGSHSTWLNYTIPASGIVEFIPTIPDGYNSFKAYAYFDGQYAREKSVSAFLTKKGDGGIQISLIGEIGQLKVGTVTFSIKCTNPVQTIYFQIYSKGELVYQDVIKSTAESSVLDENNSVEYNLDLDRELAQRASPNARVLAWYVASNGEVILDSIELVVDALFANQVSLRFNGEEILEPGNNVTLTVTAEPDSYVGLLAIDQSVVLLQDGNDITADMVKAEIARYDSGSGSPNWDRWEMVGKRRRRRSFMPWWPVYSKGSDAAELFENAGVYVMTDAYVHKEEPDFVYRGGPMMPEMRGPAGAPGLDGAPGQVGQAGPRAMDGDMSVSSSAGSSSPAEEVSIREEFPETWIWHDVTAGEDGSVSISASVPDTITSWIASAFAMSSTLGLGVADHTAKITVFKPFFISLNLPYSVIRKEEVVLQALVFNYLEEDLQVELEIPMSSNFKVRGMDEDTSDFKTIKANLTVPSNDGVSFEVWIVPQELGNLPVEVSAKSYRAADRLSRMLLVEPEGDAQEITQSYFINLSDEENDVVKIFPVQYPTEGTVPGSQRVEITAMGNPMGSMIDNLDSLIRMPYGCGEQNILTFSPNVYALMYLEATNQDQPDIRNKALKNMDAGYQRELQYWRTDDSFSAFGMSDPAGSTWLSAFVIRSFNQARKYISAGDLQNVLDRTMHFILSQEKGGQFREPGRVIHTEMQGGASKGIGLNAFTLIALLENMHDRVVPQVDSLGEMLREAIDRSTSYLVQELENIKSDPYALSLVTYALTLADSSSADMAFQYLQDLATEEDGMMYWQKGEPQTCTTYYRCIRSNDIEMSAYGLLTYVEKNSITGGLPVAKWLISKRSSIGGYGTTQDTLLALLSLTKFTILTSGDGVAASVSVSVTAGTQESTFSPISSDNSLLVQKYILSDPLVQNVQIQATGSGTAIVQVTVFYYFSMEERNRDITVEVNSTLNGTEVEITICARWLLADAPSGMVLFEVNQLTSHVANTDGMLTMYKDDGLKRVEQKSGVLSLYFDGLNSTKLCVKTKSTPTAKVENLQKRTVKASSYYNPEKSDVAFYLPLTSTSTSPTSNTVDVTMYSPTTTTSPTSNTVDVTMYSPTTTKDPKTGGVGAGSYNKPMLYLGSICLSLVFLLKMSDV